MKTKIILLAGLTTMFFSFQSLQAQLTYGVHAGGSFETQAELGELWNNCEIYQGYLIGGFLEYRVGKHISLQTEFDYQKKGEKSKSTNNGIQYVNRREFNYLTIPILLKYNYHDASLGEKLEFSFFGGPYGSRLTSASAKIKSGNETTPVNIDNQAESMDIGAILGGGVSYRLNNGGSLIAELRYQMGLVSIDKQDKDLRNKGMGITIGYKF